MDAGADAAERNPRHRDGADPLQEPVQHRRDIDRVARHQAARRREGLVPQAGTAFTEATAETATVTIPAVQLFEPGAAKPRTVTVEVQDDCGESGGAATKHFTVQSLALDVVGVS